MTSQLQADRSSDKEATALGVEREAGVGGAADHISHQGALGEDTGREASCGSAEPESGGAADGSEDQGHAQTAGVWGGRDALVPQNCGAVATEGQTSETRTAKQVAKAAVRQALQRRSQDEVWKTCAAEFGGPVNIPKQKRAALELPVAGEPQLPDSLTAKGYGTGECKNRHLALWGLLQLFPVQALVQAEAPKSRQPRTECFRIFCVPGTRKRAAYLLYTNRDVQGKKPPDGARTAGAWCMIAASCPLTMREVQRAGMPH